MFTGIIESTARAQLLNSTLSLDTETAAQIGESIAVNGVCLTVVSNLSNQLLFDVSPETLHKTNLGHLQQPALVNIERAMPANGRFSGHWVQGHIDGTGVLVNIENEGQFRKLTLQLPAPLSRYCIEKGSITLDGISLTINQVDSNTITIQIVPHTWNHTHLHSLKPGAEINIEVDILAKYTEKFIGGPNVKP